MKLLIFLVLLPLIAVAVPKQPVIDGDDAAFVDDVTLPDGSTVQGGTTVTKTWRIRNTGTVEWAGRTLRVQGRNYGFQVKAHPFSAKPGETVDVTVELVVPKKPDHYKINFKQWAELDGKWKMMLPNKNPVFIDINVK